MVHFLTFCYLFERIQMLLNNFNLICTYIAYVPYKDAHIRIADCDRFTVSLAKLLISDPSFVTKLGPRFQNICMVQFLPRTRTCNPTPHPCVPGTHPSGPLSYRKFIYHVLLIDIYKEQALKLVAFMQL